MSIILPLDIDQFQRSTLHLKGIEVGAYMLLIAAMINANGSLPDDDRLLARYAKVPTTSWGLIRELISPLFIIQDGVWQHKDVNEIIDKKAKLSSTRSQAAKSPKKNKSLNLLDLTPANAKQNDNKPVKKAEIKEDMFDEFWKHYSRKEDKEPARKAYANAIKAAKHEVIMAGLQKQVEEWKTKGTEKQFIPLAATWLNKKRWTNFDVQPVTQVDKLETIAKYIRMVDVLGRTWTLEMSREIGMDENQARLWYKQNQPEQTLF